MPLNKYVCHILHICSSKVLLMSIYRPHITLHTSKILKIKIKSYSYLQYFCHICAINKYAPQIPHVYHICQLVHVQISDNFVNIYLISTDHNQKCHHKHWYTYISHYWHMPLNKYTCHIWYMDPTALTPYTTCRPIWLHTSQKQQ